MTVEPISFVPVLVDWLWALYVERKFALALGLIIFGYEIRNYLELREITSRLHSLEHEQSGGH